jgi:hypothetical protein
MKRLKYPYLLTTYAVIFGMKIKSDHLIRQLVEILFLKLHFLWDIFQKQNCTLRASMEQGVLVKLLIASVSLCDLEERLS